MEYKIYTAKGGDTWDRIAFLIWSDESLMHLIIRENPHLANVVIFEGGEQVRIPVIEEPLNKSSLPPWRQ